MELAFQYKDVSPGGEGAPSRAAAAYGNLSMDRAHDMMTEPSFVRELTGLDTCAICSYLSSCEEPFSNSQLYSAADEAKFVDESLRLSEYRALTDPQLFEIAENLVRQVSAHDSTNDFMLVRNDVTHIRYRAGGFFKRHQDFLSLATNVVEEYTLLVCVTPTAIADATKGGETIVHVGERAMPYAATTSPGCALLFRKDVDHEGAKVEAGEKHIVSLNLWAMRKRSPQVLLVSFPSEASSATTPPASAATDAGAAALLAEANAHKYALSASDLPPGTMLATQVEWANRAADAVEAERPAIVRYEAPCTYDDFSLIFRICTCMHVSSDELVTQRHVLDYFFPSFKPEHVLVDFALAPPADGAAPSLEQSAALAAAAKLAAEKSARAAMDVETDEEVICCESEERTAVVADLARRLDLPYVRFRIIFVEGIVIFNYGGDCHKDKVPVLPAWLSLGDYDSVFVYRKLAAKVDTEPASLGELHTLANAWSARPELLAAAKAQPPHHIGRFLQGCVDWGGPEHEFEEVNRAANPEASAARGAHSLGASAALGLRVALCPTDPIRRKQLINRLLFEDRFHLFEAELAYLPDGLGRATAEWELEQASAGGQGGSHSGVFSPIRIARLGSPLPCSALVLRNAYEQAHRHAMLKVLPADLAFCEYDAMLATNATAAAAAAKSIVLASTRRNARAVLSAVADLFTNFDRSGEATNPCVWQWQRLDTDCVRMRPNTVKSLVTAVEGSTGLVGGVGFCVAWLEARATHLGEAFRRAREREREMDYDSADEYDVPTMKVRRAHFGDSWACWRKDGSDRQALEALPPAEREAIFAQRRVRCLARIKHIDERAQRSAAAWLLSDGLEDGLEELDVPLDDADAAAVADSAAMPGSPCAVALASAEVVQKIATAATIEEATAARARAAAAAVAFDATMRTEGLAYDVHFPTQYDKKQEIEAKLAAAPHVVRRLRRNVRAEPPPAESTAATPSPAVERHASVGSPTPRLFHRDVHGRTCFDEAEARLASERLVAIEFDERVKACLQRKQFLLPQHSHNMSSHFCNESVYGTLNLLSVTGLLRLEAGRPPPSPSASSVGSFDVWPPTEVRNDKRHRDYETKPRRWMDNGDESEPSNAEEEEEEGAEGEQ